MKLFKKYILKNGLRVILAPNKQNLAATALVLVEAGSKYENKNINGASHFLEHMCFKGTPKRPSALAISSELESLGAVSNAFTGHEVTGYYAKVSSEKINTALDVVSDIYLHPIFDEKEIEKEKGVVIEEINMYEDLPMRKVQDVFMKLLYGNQPAGWSLAGEKDTVRALNRQKLINYRSEHYVPQATVVIIAGAFDEKKIMAKIKSLFGEVSGGKKFSKIKTADFQKSPNKKIFYKKSDQTHLILGFRAFDMHDERKYILEVLSEILGGGMSSRLFQRVREKLGAAYYIRSGASLFTDHGFLAAFAGVDNTRAEIVIGAILDEFKKIKLSGVTNQELKRAKSHLTGKMMIDLETSDSIAGFYGEQELFKEKIKTPKEILKKIEAVTAADVAKVARTVINNSTLNLALIGPFKDRREFESVLKL